MCLTHTRKALIEVKCMNHDKYDEALAEQAEREYRREYYWNDDE